MQSLSHYAICMTQHFEVPWFRQMKVYIIVKDESPLQNHDYFKFENLKRTLIRKNKNLIHALNHYLLFPCHKYNS